MTALSEIVYDVHASDGVRLHLTELHRDIEEEAHRTDPPVFFFVHGFAQNRWAFQEGELPARLLDLGARVLLAELRGHGRARRAGMRRDWTLATHLEVDLRALLAKACEVTGAHGLHYVGHSMGGILGYALLEAAPERLASLLTLGAPVLLGRSRPLVRWASSMAVRAFPQRTPLVPMDVLLKAVHPWASRPLREGWVRGRFREAMRLTNPEVSDRASVGRVLGQSDPESVGVLLGLAEMARTGRPEIDGIDLVEAVQTSPIPIAAIIGGRDVFCARACVEPILDGPGPRRIFELEDAGHIDLTLGRQAAALAPDLVRFLVRA